MPSSTLNSTNILPVYDHELLSTLHTLSGYFTSIAHLTMLFLSFNCTPKKLLVYKLTVLNTTSWCLLVLCQGCFVLRPLPYFPLTFAKTDGPHFLTNTYGKAMFNFNLLVVFLINQNVAAGICVAGLYVFLTRNTIAEKVSRRLALTICATAHITCSLAGLYVLNFVYKPDPQLKEKVMAMYPELQRTLRPEDVLFGYVPGENPEVLSLLTWTLILFVMFYAWGSFAIIIRHVFGGIQKNDSEKAQSFKVSVFVMLFIRLGAHQLFLWNPLLFIGYLCWSNSQNTALFGALFCMIFCYGLSNNGATIAVFKPYRAGLRQVLRCGGRSAIGDSTSGGENRSTRLISTTSNMKTIQSETGNYI